MKYKFSQVLGIAFLFGFSSLFPACKHGSDDNTTPGGGTVPASGKWKISYFFDKKDETSNYQNYSFDFVANGNLTATNGGQTYSGTWSSGYDDSKNKFLINFDSGAPSNLLELNEDWLIIEMKDDSMHFEHTSGGNGDTDVLKFVKI